MLIIMSATILVIDNDRQALSSLASALQREGYRVIFEENSLRYKETILQQKPDLILLEIQTPSINGFEICKNLKADPALRYIPVVFISNLTDETNHIAALESGGSDLIPKPVHVKLALARIKSQLGQIQLQNSLQNEKRQLEERNAILQHNEQELEKFNSIMQHVSVGVVITDLEGYIEYVNDSYCEITGYTREELLGKHTRVLKSGKHDEKIYKNLWETITSAKVWRGELLNRKKDRSLYWEFATISPLFNDEGKLAKYIAIKEDTNELKTTKKFLEERDTQNLAILESMQEGLIFYGSDGSILTVNPAALRILGLSQEQFLDQEEKPRQWALCLEDGKILAEEKDPVKRCFATKESQRDIQLMVRSGEGDLKWILQNVEPILNGENDINFVVSTFTDISAQKRHELRVKEQYRYISTINALRKTILDSENLQDLVQSFCSVITTHMGYDNVWIGKYEQKPQEKITILAEDGKRGSFWREIQAKCANILNTNCSTALAIHEKRVAVLCSDEMEAEIWKEMSLEEDFLCIAAAPVLIDGEVFGNVTVYSAQEGGIDTEEQQFLLQVTQELSLAIELNRADLEKQKSQKSLTWLNQAIVAINTSSGKKELFDKTAKQMAAAINDSVVIVSEVVNEESIIPQSIASKNEEILNHIDNNFPLGFVDKSFPLNKKGRHVYDHKKIHYFEGGFVNYFEGYAPKDVFIQLEQLLHVKELYTVGLSVDEALKCTIIIIKLNEEGIQNEEYLLSFLHQVSLEIQALELKINLTNSEERFKKLSDLSFEGIVLHRQGVAIDFNESFCRISGYDRDELLGQNLLQKIIHPDYLPKVSEMIQKKEAHPYEAMFRNKAGEDIPIEIESRDIQYDNENFRVSAIRDIRERKKMEKELIESQERYKSLFDFLPVAVGISSLSGGKVVEVNERLVDLLGYSLEEIEQIGKTDLLYKNPDDRKKIVSLLEKDGSVRDKEITFINKNGSEVHTLANYDKIQIKNENQLLVAFLDITEKKNTERKIWEKDRLIRSVLETSTAGIMIFRSLRDEFGNIVDFEWILSNDAAALLLNQSNASLVGKNILSTLPGFKKVGVFDLFVDVVETETNLNHEFYYGYEGLSSWFHCIAVKLDDGLQVSILDISKSKENEQKIFEGSEVNANLARISKEIMAPHLTIDDIAILIQKEAIKISGSKNACVSIIDKKRGENIVYTYALSDYQEISQKKNHTYIVPAKKDGSFPGLCGFSINSKRSFFTSDLNKFPPAMALPEIYSPLINFLSVPIIFENEILGQVAIFNRPDGFNEEILKRIERLASLLAFAIERKRNENKLKQMNETLEKRVHDRTLKLLHTMENLANREKEYRNLVEFIPVGIVISQGDKLVYLNRAAMNVLQVNEDLQSKDQSLISFIYGKDRAQVSSMFQEALDQGFSPYRELEVNTLTEKSLFVGLEAARIIYENNPAIMVVIQDLSDRKKAEELRKAKSAAEAKNNAKSIFLANMSHEIRTPMNAILGFTEILSKKISDDESQSYLQAINNSGKTLLTLINDILDLSKVEAGKVELKYVPVNIESIFTEVQDIFAVKANEKGLKLILNMQDNSQLFFLLDETRLRQVLINLIGNGVKFTEEGYIKISFSFILKNDEHADLKIQIEDTGVGIADDQKDYIFGAFNQHQGRDYHKLGGTGLGLAITKQLVQLMNGQIALKSELDKGSIFTLNFPDVEIFKENEYLLTKEKAKPFLHERVIFNKAKILIADDIILNRNLLKVYLSEFNFDIMEAKNGAEVIELVEQVKPDLIFLDMKMPVMDGYETIKILKEEAKFKEIPIVVVTASAMMDSHGEIKRISNGFLQKPLNREKILEFLLRFIPFKKEADTGSKDKKGPSAINYSDLSFEQLRLFFTQVDNLQILELLEKNLSIFNMKKVCLFQERLNNLDKIEPLSYLTELEKKLQQQIRQFDVAEIKITLNDINSLFQDLKNQYSKIK